MLKKLTAIILAILMLCVPLVSCAANGEEIPDGMQAAYVEGEPFKLYIPEGWALNTRSGISGGYSLANETMTITARYITPADAELTSEAYLAQCSEEYAKILKDYVVITACEATLLGGANAHRLVYTMKDKDIYYTCTQISAKHEGLIVSLYFYCPTESAESMHETFESVREAFAFAPLSEDTGDAVTDDKTPAGMKIASDKDAAYRLYVPAHWVCDSESGISEAHVNESGRPNVTVTLYEPTRSMSIDDYFSACETEYAQRLMGYTRLSSAERTVAGRRAVSYTYSAKYGDTSYRIMQTVFSDGRIMYSITYTALDSSFDAHLGDVDAILSAFQFR